MRTSAHNLSHQQTYYLFYRRFSVSEPDVQNFLDNLRVDYSLNFEMVSATNLN